MIGAVLAAFVVACAARGFRGEPPEHRPGLYSLLIPRDATGAFAVAMARFDRAAEDYRRERFLAAAEGFMEAAALLRRAESEVETWRVDREWTYKNAAAAFEAAGAATAGRAALSVALVEDPPCAEVLRDLLRALAARDGS